MKSQRHSPPACRLIAAACLLLAAVPLRAQQTQPPPLKGGVTEDQVNPQYQTTAENEIHISELVANIIRLVPATSSNESRFNEAVAEFDKYRASRKYGAVANQYTPCVQKALAAVPHSLKAYEIAKELTRAATRQRALEETYRRETQLARDLLTAAGECLDNTPANNNVYNQTRRGNPPGNRPADPPQRAGTDNGTSYYPGIPNIPWRSPCQPDGPGGYDYCNNPGPPPPAPRL